jgi:tetratricopeptide (TPR) repeat protein
MKHPIAVPTVLAALISLSLPAAGMYMQAETQDIPLQRLIENLTEKSKADPADANVVHQLARAHAIAYSNKLADADPVKTWTGWKKDQPEQPWFFPESPHVPFRKVTDTPDADKLAAAKTHLATAIETYRKALAAKPDDTTIMLGLAWCQDQVGEKTDAIAGYRKVAKAAWEKESKSHGGLGNFLFVETAGYLVPLLDPTKDAAEIAELNERKQKLLALPRAVTPLVIPVGNEASSLQSLVDPSARVRFDLDGSGRQLEWPWITRNAAWLVFDPKQTGHITSSIQMFGNRSFLLFCNDGYESLALLDDDANGSISGSELNGIALWRDLNSNGISDPGEVKSVSEYHITSLSTTRDTHPSGIPFSAQGVTFEDGSTRPTYDLILESK